MLTVGDVALVQLTSEHGDAVHPSVVPEPVAGHADLAAAGPEQGSLIEGGTLLDRDVKPRIQRLGRDWGKTHG